MSCTAERPRAESLRKVCRRGAAETNPGPLGAKWWDGVSSVAGLLILGPTGQEW